MGNGFDNTNANQQQVINNGLNASDVYPPPQPNNQPWRPGYNQVAPIYGQVDGTIGAPNTQNGGTVYEGGVPVQPRPVQPNTGGGYIPPYQTVPGADTQTQGGNNGPVFNPGGTAYNPGEQQVPVVQGPPNPQLPADTQYSPPAKVVQPIGVFAGSFMGGLGGIVGGNLIPAAGNKAAEAILGSGSTVVAEGAAIKPGFFAPGGGAEKIFGEKFTGQVNKGLGNLGTRAEGFNAGSTAQEAAVKWQNQFDPRFQARPGLQQLFETNNAALTKFRIDHPMGPLPEAAQAELTKLEARQKILATGEGAAAKLNPTLFTAEGKAAMEGLKGAATLTEAELALVKGHGAKLNSAFPAVGAATKEVAMLERPMVGNFAKGAAFVGGTLLADHLAGKIMGGDGAAHLSNVALPMAFVAGNTWREKAIYSAAAIVGSKAIDAMLPASDHTTINRIMAPNSVDSLTMGAAFLLPAGDAKTRMAMIGTAYGFGRLRNMNDTEGLLTTGALAGATGLALHLGKIDKRIAVGLLAAEGGAFVLSRVFRGNST